MSLNGGPKETQEAWLNIKHHGFIAVNENHQQHEDCITTGIGLVQASESDSPHSSTLFTSTPTFTMSVILSDTYQEHLS